MEFEELKSAKRAVEWPTLVLAILIYGMWFAATLFWRALPWPVLAALGSVAVAWHMSLQHEIIHNHPTRWRRLNRAIGAWPLALWLPFDVVLSPQHQQHND